MRKLIFYLLSMPLFIVSLSVKAQNFALGAKGGISIPNLTGGNDKTPLSTGYTSRLGADACIFGEFTLSKLFSLEPMIEYSSQGGKKDGLQAFPTPAQVAAMYPAGEAPEYLYANYKSQAKLNYLMIPVLAKFGWNFSNSPLRFYVEAGPFVGFLVSAKQVASGQSELYNDPAGTEPLPGGQQSFDNTQDIKDQLHTVNFGIEGNIGLSYRFGRNNVFIEGGGNYGFLNIQKVAQDGKNNTGAANVLIGYSFWFLK